MAAVEVPQTLEYRGGQLNVVPVLEVLKGSAVQKQLTKLNVTNVVKRVTLQETAGQKLQNLSDDNEMVEVKVLMALAKENDAVNKEGAKNGEWVKISMIKDFQDNPDDEEDIRSSHEYLNDLEEEYQARALLAKSKRFFKIGTQSSSQHKPKLRHTKDFQAKYNKVKAKLALLSSSSSASMLKNKGLITKAYEWDEEMSSDDNEMVEVKVLMALAEENDAVNKEGAKNGEWVKISMRKVHTLLEMEVNDDRKVCLDYLCIDLNYVKEQRTTDYDSPDESSFCSIPLPPLKMLDDGEPISGSKTIKSILRSKSTIKAEALKDVTINEPSLAHAKERKINPRNPQHAFKKCKVCGSLNHTTTDHYDIKWFKRGEALQARKDEALKSTRAESSNVNRSKTPTKRNSTLVNFYDEKGISQNFSSPYIPEQNGVAERKNRTLIEAARTRLS
nr:putative ribonuclease H-like domain-containing protein [Tanacetum cinerariifolium]